MIFICEVLYNKNNVRRSVRFSLDFTQMRHKSSANDTRERRVSKQQERKLIWTHSRITQNITFAISSVKVLKAYGKWTASFSHNSINSWS